MGRLQSPFWTCDVEDDPEVGVDLVLVGGEQRPRRPVEPPDGQQWRPVMLLRCRCGTDAACG
jgi:hypothetical protein